MDFNYNLFSTTQEPSRPTICESCPFRNRKSFVKSIIKKEIKSRVAIVPVKDRKTHEEDNPYYIPKQYKPLTILPFPLCPLVYPDEIVPVKVYKKCKQIIDSLIRNSAEIIVSGAKPITYFLPWLDGAHKDRRHFGKKFHINGKLYRTELDFSIVKQAPEYLKLEENFSLSEPIKYKVNPIYILGDDSPNMGQFLASLDTIDEVIIDIETNGLKDVLFNIGINKDKNNLFSLDTEPIITAIGIGIEQDIYIFPVDHRKVKYEGTLLKELILPLIAEKRLVGANIGFDIAWLHKKMNMPLPKQARDILFEYYLLWQVTYTGGLKEIAQRMFNYFDWEHGKPTENWSVIDWDSLSTYLAHDINATRMIADELWKRLQQHPVWDFYINHAINNPITYTDIHIRGIKVRPINSKYVERALVRIDKLILEYAKQVGWKKTTINPDSEKDLKKLFFNILNLEPVEYTDKGEPALDKYSLSVYAQQGIKLARAILQHRMVAKLLSTYYSVPDTHSDKEMIIRPEIGFYRTESGRTACVKPNFQNLPRSKSLLSRKVKEMVISRYKDGLILETDYSQAELRCLASVANEPAMINEYMKQFADIAYEPDLHTRVVTIMLNLPWEEAKKKRHIGKIINFGIVYGMTPKGLSRLLNVSIEEAAEYMEAYLEAVPNVRKYMEKYRAFAKKHGYILSPTGRRRLILGATNEDSFLHFSAMNKAINTPIQAVASDMKMQAINELNRLYKELDVPARVILEVHDSIVTDVFDPKYLIDIIQLAEQTMSKQKFKGIKVPLLADSKVGKSWGTTKAVKYKTCWSCDAVDCPYRKTKQELTEYLKENKAFDICPASDLKYYML